MPWTRPDARVAESLYETTQAIQRELADLTWAVYSVGDAVQQGVVDLAFDLASGSMTAARVRSSEWIHDAWEGVESLSSPRRLEQSWRRTRNNIEVYNLVKNRGPRLPIDAAGDVGLARLIGDASALGPYADLWAIEGLGHDYTANRLVSGDSATSILRAGPAADLPAGSLTMMHAGLGLALAERLLPRLTPWSPHQLFVDVLSEYIALCDFHGRPGYIGAAYESLGLVARTWHPALVGEIAATCTDMGGGVSGYFWHGAGRALYFLPAYIVSVLSPWNAAAREAPDEDALRNLDAGLAWAWTLVNLRQPEIFDVLSTQLTDAMRRDAVINGMASALVVRIDTTPDNPYVLSLLTRSQHGPGEIPAAWGAIVHDTVDAALNRFHPILRDHGVLDAIFRYTDLARLSDGLEAPEGQPHTHAMPSARSIPASASRSFPSAGNTS